MRQHSRWLRLLALVLGVTLVAAACGDDDDSETSGDETTTTAEEGGGASAAPAVGEAAPTCQGESDGVLGIGGLLPQTGDLAFLGPPMEAGAALGIEDVNAAGGVLGKPAEFIAGDSGDGDPDIANPTVDGHLAAGVDEILGAAASGVSLNVIDKITKENCKIHFSPANTSPEFTDYDDGDLYFRTAPSDVLQGRILSDLIVEDGHTTVALLARQDSYGEGLLEFTKQPLEEQGAEVVVERVYDPEAQTFSAEVDEVISADPDALVMIGFAESSIIMNDLFEQGFTPDEKGIYLVDGNIGNALGEEFSDPGVLVGIKGTLPTAELTEDFRGRLLETDPALVDFSYGPESYDAVIITALAAEVAGTDDPAQIAANINGVTRDGTECTTYEECKQLIADGEDIDYNGPSGPQEFSQPGEPTAATFAVMSYGEDNQIDDSATEFREASF